MTHMNISKLVQAWVSKALNEECGLSWWGSAYVAELAESNHQCVPVGLRSWGWVLDKVEACVAGKMWVCVAECMTLNPIIE